MQYNQKQLLKMFVEENPQYDIQEVEKMVKLYWTHLKTKMESEKLQKLRVKYFGVFEVRFGRVKAFDDLVKRTKDVTHPDVHNKYREIIDNYYKNYK